MDTSELPAGRRMGGGKKAGNSKKGAKVALAAQHGPLKLSGKRGNRSAKQLKRKLAKAEKVRLRGPG